MGQSNIFNIFDFNGIPVPYIPKEEMTIVNPKGDEIREVKAQYINNLDSFLKTGNTRSILNAVLSMKKEILLNLLGSMSFKTKGIEGPIAVASWVDPDCVFIDRKNGRIVLNVFQATHRYRDADGDRILIAYNKMIYRDADGDRVPDEDLENNDTYGVGIKWPITSQPDILKIVTPTQFETFSPLTLEELEHLKVQHPVRQIGEDKEYEKELFYKKHREVGVGLLTNMFNNFDLFTSQDMEWTERMEYIFNSLIDPLTQKTLRSLRIEELGMKAARKEGQEHEEDLNILGQDKSFGMNMTLVDPHAWALTSCSSIGTMEARQLAWLKKETDLEALTEKILKLDVAFREVKGAPKAPPVGTFIEGGLLKRLRNLRLVNWIELPHGDKRMPPSVIFWLQLPNGAPVAMTDVKRNGKNDDTHTYMVLLPPVWDNRDIYNADGTIAIPATKKWVHPINHMQKILTQFDSLIRFGGDVVGHWPRDWKQFNDPKYSVKMSMLFQFMNEYCGKYGDPSPAEKDPTTKKVHPTEMAHYTVRQSVVIDYGRPMNHVDMYEVAKEANALGNICIVGSKGDDREIRKYVLANKMGGAIWDRECVCSPYRPAANRSQLQRVLGFAKYKVAVLKTSSLNQIFITPSGVEKQKTNKAFFRRVFNSKAAYERHLERANLTPEQCPVDEGIYNGWNAEVRKAWTISARHTIKIGKLVDLYGNKFMPLGMSQVFTKDPALTDTEEIDLIMPIHELLDKSAHIAFLRNATEQDILLPDGSTVRGLVVEATFYRTGAGSENIPLRERSARYKGIDSYPIEWQCSKIMETEPRSIDFEFAQALQTAMGRIMEAYSIDDREE